MATNRTQEEIKAELWALDSGRPDYWRGPGTKEQKAAAVAAVKAWNADPARQVRKSALQEELAEAKAHDSQAMRGDVIQRLLSLGFAIERAEGDSVYLRYGTSDYQVRVSNHQVPYTDQRAYDAENGGFSWADAGHQNIVIASGSNLERAESEEHVASIAEDIEEIEP